MIYGRFASRMVSLEALVAYLAAAHPAWDAVLVEAQAQQWMALQRQLDVRDKRRDRSFYRRQSLWADPHLARTRQAGKRPGPSGST